MHSRAHYYQIINIHKPKISFYQACHIPPACHLFSSRNTTNHKPHLTGWLTLLYILYSIVYSH